MAKGLAAASAALTALMLIPASAPAKRIAGVDVQPGCDFIGPGRVPVPVAERLLHEARQTHRDRPAPRARQVRDAAQQERQADRPEGHEPRRRLQPGSAMLVKVPGLDTPAAAASSNLPPLTNLKRGLAKRSPVVVINAAPGSATRSGPRSTRTRSGAKRPRADHPPGAQLRRGRALHRRAPQPEERARAGRSGQARLPPLPRPHQHGREARSRAGARTSSRSSER